MSELPAGTKPARLKVGVSPRPPWACKPGTELGAAPTFAVPNPDSRLGLSPHSQGRVMDEPSAVFVGIDVSKGRLDVHLRPSGEVFCVSRDAEGITRRSEMDVEAIFGHVDADEDGGKFVHDPTLRMRA